MRRFAVLALLLVALAAVVAAGCGGEEEVTPTPDTVSGTTEAPPTETEPTETETEPTETETETETEPTETETETQPPAEGDAAAGREIFVGASACGTCHTLSDAGTSGTIGPNLDDAQPSFELAVDRVTNGAGAMPSFSGSLSEQQIADVATYVSTAAGG